MCARRLRILKSAFPSLHIYTLLLSIRASCVSEAPRTPLVGFHSMRGVHTSAADAEERLSALRCSHSLFASRVACLALYPDREPPTAGVMACMRERSTCMHKRSTCMRMGRTLRLVTASAAATQSLRILHQGGAQGAGCSRRRQRQRTASVHAPASPMRAINPRACTRRAPFGVLPGV